MDKLNHIEIKLKNITTDKSIHVNLQLQLAVLAQHIPNMVAIEVDKASTIDLILNPNTLILHKADRLSLVLVS